MKTTNDALKMQIISIKTIQVYAARTEQLEALLSEANNDGVNISAGYTLSINPEPADSGNFAAHISLTLLTGDEKDRFAQCDLITVFTGYEGMAALPENEKATLLAEAAYPYARNKLQTLIQEIGFPVDLPFQPPEFTLTQP